MKGKLVPIPIENIGAVRVALGVRIDALLQYLTTDTGRLSNVKAAVLADIAALTWARDNCQECSEVEIGGGH